MDKLLIVPISTIASGLVLELITSAGRRIRESMRRDFRVYLAHTEGHGLDNMLGELTLTIVNRDEVNHTVDAIYWQRGLLRKRTYRQFGFHSAQRYHDIDIQGNSSHELSSRVGELMELVQGRNPISRLYRALTTRIYVKFKSGKRVHDYLGWRLIRASCSKHGLIIYD